MDEWVNERVNEWTGEGGWVTDWCNIYIILYINEVCIYACESVRVCVCMWVCVCTWVNLQHSHHIITPVGDDVAVMNPGHVHDRLAFLRAIDGCHTHPRHTRSLTHSLGIDYCDRWYYYKLLLFSKTSLDTPLLPTPRLSSLFTLSHSLTRLLTHSLLS